MDFGRGPLSHPLVVDAIQTSFVPVCIYNNKKGEDARVLERLGEPAWNNPVVRFLDAKLGDLVPRRGGVYTLRDLLPRMTAALAKAGRPVPAYLRLLEREHAPAKPTRLVFTMGCYWEGERRLGALDGVLSTRIGSIGHREVVEVTFDAAVVSPAKLTGEARRLQCARLDSASAEIDARTAQKYHLRRHDSYLYLPLTPLQQTRINAALASGQDAGRFLSPSQREARDRIAALGPRAKARLKALTPLPGKDRLAAYARRLAEIIRPPAPR